MKEVKTKEILLGEAWQDTGLAMDTAKLEVMIDIRNSLIEIEKRINEHATS